MSLKKATSQRGSNPLEQVVSVFARHIDARPHYLVGVALWALHTHIYNQYDKSPRLAILSPVKNCGKSTVLNILAAMVWNSEKITASTVASMFRLAGSHTLLLDEVDNMPITKDTRAILNDGHGVGTSVKRTGKDGEVISYPIYGPVALAGIGQLPATLMSRSVIIRLHRSAKELIRFNTRQEYYAPALAGWAAKANLHPDPQMPVHLIGRDADKWRPLIAIADFFDRGEIARKVALDFLKESDTFDIKESVLRDTRKVFDKVRTNILSADALYQKLRNDKDGEYEVDYVEHKVTKRKIGDILADFQIRSKPHRYKGGTPTKCWFKEDFQEMWDRYA